MWTSLIYTGYRCMIYLVKLNFAVMTYPTNVIIWGSFWSTKVFNTFDIVRTTSQNSEGFFVYHQYLTICLDIGLTAALYRLFLKNCYQTSKAVETKWPLLRSVSKPHRKRLSPDLRSLWLLIRTQSVRWSQLASKRAEHSLPMWLLFLINNICYPCCVLDVLHFHLM